MWAAAQNPWPAGKCECFPVLKNAADHVLGDIVDRQESIRDEFHHLQGSSNPGLLSAHQYPPQLQSGKPDHLGEAIEGENQGGSGGSGSRQCFRTVEKLAEDFVGKDRQSVATRDDCQLLQPLAAGHHSGGVVG